MVHEGEDHMFKKNHCQMGNKGNAAFMFDHLGCIEIPATINTEKKDSSVGPNRTLDELYEIVLNTDLAGKRENSVSIITVSPRQHSSCPHTTVT